MNHFVSSEDLDGYIAQVEAALASCSDSYDVGMLAKMHPYFSSGDEALSAGAMQAACDIADGLYLRSAAAQDAAADAFCGDVLGIRAAGGGARRSYAAPIVREAARAASEVGGDAAAAYFADAVSRRITHEATGCANERMERNCRQALRSDKRIRYAYVPSSRKVCGICCMFASRGFDFKPCARPKLHDKCRCMLVPGIQWRTRIEGYDDMAYHRGFLALAERDRFGYIARDADGMVVFRKDALFDAVERKVVRRERAVGHSSTERKQDRALVSGALNNVNDPSGERRRSFAVSYYDQIRNRDRDSVIKKLSENSGIRIETAENAYEHLFLRKYNLYGGYRVFDPDYDMAQSLQRLIDLHQVFLHDVILVRREALEFKYMAEGMDYDAAHRKANERYDYYKALTDWKGSS